MRINEVTTNLNTYIATVRVVLQDGATIVKTQVFSDGVNQAKAMLIGIYGVGNVLTLSQLTKEEVTEETKTLSAAELQVKSLADQSKRLNQQAKQLKARQSLKKAESNLIYSLKNYK